MRCFNNFECLPNFYKYLFGRDGQCTSCLKYQLSCKIDREIQMTLARTLAHILVILTERLEIFMNYVRKIFDSYFCNIGWPDRNIYGDNFMGIHFDVSVAKSPFSESSLLCIHFSKSWFLSENWRSLIGIAWIVSKESCYLPDCRYMFGFMNDSCLVIL